MFPETRSLPLLVPPAHYDVICVGGGPANLALAEELTASLSRLGVLILDLGRNLDSRNCPLASHGVCPPCGICHVVHGVAGAGAYSDGKVSFWPAGSGLLPLAGNTDAMLRLDARLRRYYQRLRDSRSMVTTCADSRQLARSLRDSSLQLKAYDVIHAGSEAIQEFYLDKQRILLQRGVEIQGRARVTDIMRTPDNTFRVSWQHGGRSYTTAARHVVLGTGKSSGRWLRSMLSKLHVAREFTEIEPGIRLEMPHAITERLASCHRDAKIKTVTADGSEVRTFCLCQRGFVLAAYYDDMSTVSGYSLRDRSSDNTNLALLNRIALGPRVDPYEELLPSVQAQNRLAGGGATVQRLGDFLADTPTSDEHLSSNPVRPTLASAMPGRIELPLGDRVRRNLLDAIYRIDRICPGFAAPTNLVYGPVLEKCWDRVCLTSMRTTSANVYVVGDAAGHARGLVQSAATGILAAQAIMATIREASP
jgi:hypothetical protein